MVKKTLVHVGCVGLLLTLAACGGSPEDGSTPSVSEPVMESFSISEPSATTPSGDPEPIASETPPQSLTPEPEESQSSEPRESPSLEPEEPASTEEIPSSMQGRWIFIGEGEPTRECTDAQEAEGTIIEIDAATISSFAWVAELASVEENDSSSFQGVFTYQDDSDEPITQEVHLETQEDGQMLVYTELGENVDLAPARYGRCS